MPMVDTIKIKEQRSDILDAARGGVILLMLLGHCIQYVTPHHLDFFENPVFKFIYSFHMPLFMLISGFLLGKSLLNQSNYFEYSGKRILNLLQPLVLGGILNYLIILVGRVLFSSHLQLSEIFDMRRIASAITGIWFLWSVIAATVATAISFEITKNAIYRLFFLLLFLPIVLLFPNPAQNFYMYPIFIVGVFASYYNILEKVGKHSILKILCIVSFLVLLMFLEKKHIAISAIYDDQISLKENFKIYLMRFAIGMVGSLSFLILVGFIFQKLNKKCFKI